MHVPPPPELDATGLSIAVVVSRYHRDITAALLDGAVETYTAAGGAVDDLLTVAAPGAFELTALTQALARRPDVDGIVALGCIIRGETTHDQYLAQAVANGLTRVTLDTGKPVAFGVLTCQTLHQARDRAGGVNGNKGEEAMAAAIEAIRSVRSVSESGNEHGAGRTALR
ncbi:MAG: 6,7-dimethyl-8-ribityllumazine synthase [Planctomycetes bacterium]|nr:6,7-dimethyl-8-ribityllumazine synthase [Planctomycetota bacterium]